MKNIKLNVFVIALLLFYACNQGKNNNLHEDGHKHQEANMDHEHQKSDSSTKKKKPLSPKKSVMTSIGDMHIHIDYGAPSVRDRVVWGGLVAYGKVWSTGAHQVTSMDINKDFNINGQLIPAGKYALFTVPGKEEWTIILNKNWNQHLADDYDEAEDVMRWNVTPKVEGQIVEQLAFEILPGDEKSATVRFQWEKISFEFVISSN